MGKGDVLQPADPKWPNRDRFVLSNGHACALLYCMLHLTGYDISLDDLKQFRQLGSKTPGHPENTHTPGVEVATGPLGQGIANGVGMALGQAHMAGTFNRPGFDVVDNYTFVICGDGCLQEGVSSEASSLAATSASAGSSCCMTTTRSRSTLDRPRLHRGCREALRSVRLAGNDARIASPEPSPGGPGRAPLPAAARCPRPQPTPAPGTMAAGAVRRAR